MAHSNESNAYEMPCQLTVKHLSVSFPHVSQRCASMTCPSESREPGQSAFLGTLGARRLPCRIPARCRPWRMLMASRDTRTFGDPLKHRGRHGGKFEEGSLAPGRRRDFGRWEESDEASPRRRASRRDALPERLDTRWWED